MQKKWIGFVLAAIMAASSPLFAAEGRDAQGQNASTEAKKDTIFNRASDFFSTFDRPFTRKENKQGFWEATASWIKNIDKDE